MPARVLAKSLTDEQASKLVEAGLPWPEAEFLAGELAVPIREFARLVSISESTLFRRQRSKRFTPEESDHIVRFGRLWTLANEVFESAEGARKWLKTPQLGLAGRIPLHVAKTEAGAREVETLLKRIDYGILA
jgi:putative toxin-antitoxin system antitoxin component (TIGR02293 family)